MSAMDRTTRKRIDRMDVPARQRYAAAIELELQRARDKQQRLEHALHCIRDEGHREMPLRRLRRLEKQIATLDAILAYATAGRRS